MNDKTTSRAHWSHWVIGAVALLFNLMGVANYFVQMNPESLASFPEAYRAIIDARPAWATTAFAIAVFGGAIGAILLLLRKSMAVPVFTVALIGVLLSMLHMYRVIGFGPLDVWLGILMQLVLTIPLIWYARWATRKGMLS